MWKWEIADVDGKKVWKRVEKPVVPVVMDSRVGRQATADRRKPPIYPPAGEI